MNDVVEYLLTLHTPKKQFFGNKTKTHVFETKSDLIMELNKKISDGHYIEDIVQEGVHLRVVLTSNLEDEEETPQHLD